MQDVVPETETLLLTKTLNRSVTGSMTDMVKLAEYMVIEENDSLEQVAAKLNVTPFKALDYEHPCDRFSDLTVRSSDPQSRHIK